MHFKYFLSSWDLKRALTEWEQIESLAARTQEFKGILQNHEESPYGEHKPVSNPEYN